VSCAKTGGPILTICTSITCFPGRMSRLEASLIMSPIPLKNLHYGGVNRHFQAKLADCRWLAVCRLQVDRFLPIAGEMLSAGGSVRPDTHYR